MNTAEVRLGIIQGTKAGKSEYMQRCSGRSPDTCGQLLILVIKFKLFLNYDQHNSDPTSFQGVMEEEP